MATTRAAFPHTLMRLRRGTASGGTRDWRVIAMTLVNVKWFIDRDGELTITWPDGHVSRDERALVLASAA
jgi:hypothetical protein